MHPARTVKKAVSKVSHYIIRATFSHDAMRGVVRPLPREDWRGTWRFQGRCRGGRGIKIV